MAEPRRIGPRHYYDLLPPTEHRCGDIWTGIPTMGLLGSKSIPGLVVTPACDLSRKKTETITILPVVPVRVYFSTVGLLPEVRARVKGALTAGQFQSGLDWGPYEFRPPTHPAIAKAMAEVQAHIGAKTRGAKELAALDRALAGLRVILAIGDPELTDIQPEDLASVFGSEWEKMKGRIITNAYSSDIHFLPSDEQDLPFSGLQAHSVALFRYPITLPIEILDIARDSSPIDWHGTVERHAPSLPIIRSFVAEMPIKTLSRRGEFLADLLTRYVSVYTRLGSPDFTQASVGRMSSEIGG
jgi:hypothetical protein